MYKDETGMYLKRVRADSENLGEGGGLNKNKSGDFRYQNTNTISIAKQHTAKNSFN